MATRYNANMSDMDNMFVHLTNVVRKITVTASMPVRVCESEGARDTRARETERARMYECVCVCVCVFQRACVCVTVRAVTAGVRSLLGLLLTGSIHSFAGAYPMPLAGPQPHVSADVCLIGVLMLAFIAKSQRLFKNKATIITMSMAASGQWKT